MNRKAFTLIELLAVIVILSLISLVSLPNVYKSFDNTKKEQYITDAKNLIKTAKYRFKLKKYEKLFINNGNCSYITMKNLGYQNKKTVDNNLYDLEQSRVLICLEDESYSYYVRTITSERGVYNTINDGYIKEENLNINQVRKID